MCYICWDPTDEPIVTEPVCKCLNQPVHESCLVKFQSLNFTSRCPTCKHVFRIRLVLLPEDNNRVKCAIIIFRHVWTFILFLSLFGRAAAETSFVVAWIYSSYTFNPDFLFVPLDLTIGICILLSLVFSDTLRAIEERYDRNHGRVWATIVRQ
jgi:hypothetical protein